MRSVAKGNFIKGKRGKSHAASHVRYVQFRRGDDRDKAGGKARLFFDDKRENINGREVLAHVRRQDERLVVHRIVLSPGLDGVDMTAYTRAVMTELSRQKGQDLDYFATVHKNTDHEHAHVVLMGKDKNGQEVGLYKEQYRTIRDAGDAYLERHHFYERYLNKELPDLMKTGYVRTLGDDSFENLLRDLESTKSFEELEKERQEQARLQKAEAENNKFDLEKAVAKLPESEKIRTHNNVYTKHTPLEELQQYAARLKGREEARLEVEDYKMLGGWIRTKEAAGDDYYEKTGENERIQRHFEEELKRSLQTDNSPPRSFRQYVYETGGRLLEFHESYEINRSRQSLKDDLKRLDESAEDDPERRKEIEEHLEWLKELSDERIRPTPQRQEKEKVSSDVEKKSKERKDDDKDEREPKVDAREAGQEKEAVKGQAPAPNERTGRARDDEGADRDEEEQERNKELEERDRQDEQKEREDQDRLKEQERTDDDRRDEERRAEQDQQDRDRERAERDDRDRLERETNERERDQRDQEERLREDDEQRARHDQVDKEREQRRLAEEFAKAEAERMLRQQQELERLKQQQLEPGTKDGYSRLQRKIDEVTQEIEAARAGQTKDVIERAEPALDVEKDIDLDEPSHAILDEVQPHLDLEQGVEETWSVEEKSTDDREIEDLLNGLDRADEQQHMDPQANINSVLFGDSGHELGDFERLPEEERLDNWQRDAFNPELIKEQQDRPTDLEQALSGEVDHASDPTKDLVQQQQQQQSDVAMQQVQQTLQVQIQQAFEPQIARSDDSEHSAPKEKEQELDQGGEHSR